MPAPASALSRRNALLICLSLAAASLIVYARSLSNDFINYDDRQYITENLHLREGLTGGSVRWAFTTYEAGNWHPLTWISHALDVQLFGLSPSGHHFHSVLLHALNVVLLFLLLWKATGSQGRSLVVAALFALHPLNVECVAWAAERKSLLSTLLFMLTLGAYGWYARRPSIARYGMVGALFALGLMAKPMVITLPFVLLLLDYWPLQRVESWTSPREPWAISRKSPAALFFEKVPWFVLSAASALITLAAQHQAQALAALSIAPIHSRIQNAVCSYALYLVRAVWPVRLAPFYPLVQPTLVEVLASSALLIAICVWVWRERTSRPYLVTGWLWYLGMLIPVIGLVQVGSQAMADRYAYIPLIGIFVMIVWRLADVAHALAYPLWLRRVVVAAVLIALAALTARQTVFWQNSVSLWTHTLQVTRDNLLAEANLGTALMDLGRDDQAMAHFRNAVRLQPSEPKTHLALGTLLEKQGDQRAAVEQFQVALPLTRDRNDLLALYTNLGVAYRELGDYNAALQSFGQLVQLDPSNLQAAMALGRMRILATAEQMTRDLARHPSADGFSQLGTLWEQAGEVARAQQAYQSALALNRKLVSARDGLNRLARTSP